MAKPKKGKTKKPSKKTGTPEIFEVEKDGVEKVKELNSKEEPEEKVSKLEIEKENKQLKYVFIGIGILILSFLFVFFLNYKSTNFEHEGVKYDMVREGSLIFYHTTFDLRPNEIYNFYIRNDPRKLTKDVPFNGNYLLYKDVVINSTSEFNCDGDGIIAVANFANVHGYFGSKVVKDETASCVPGSEYNYILLEEGEETRIDEFDQGCYKISINNCEILEGTERFIVETFSVANENLR